MAEPQMSEEDILRDRLHKIEALYAGAATSGERAAAGAAAERIRTRIAEIGAREPAVEVRFSIPDPWSRKLFLALCRRYGLKPYRYARMQRQTVIVRGPRSFLEGALWREFGELSGALSSYLSEITSKVISEEVWGDAEEADEVPEPKHLG